MRVHAPGTERVVFLFPAGGAMNKPKEEFLKLRLDPRSAYILNKLASATFRSKAMTVRFLIRAAGAALVDTGKIQDPEPIAEEKIN
jgi:hypothetical protein